jgi:nicotinate phosphoribosyltransferase
MGVSYDAPALDFVYKLCEYGGEGRTKLSTGKPILPGRKQVFRAEEGSRAAGDTIARAGESLPGHPLLRLMMKNGRRVADAASDLQQARDHAARAIARLPARVTGLEAAAPPYPVVISAALEDYHDRTKQRIRAG